MRTREFLNRLDHERLAAAIAAAEAKSRGELRVHVTTREVDDVQAEAALQFEKLGMTQTAERNAILIYVAPASQSFAVIGDTAIHERCGPEFWRDMAAALTEEFRAGRFTEGLLRGVAAAGEALARHFPRTQAPDHNELPDEVTED